MKLNGTIVFFLSVLQYEVACIREVIPCNTAGSILARQYYARKGQNWQRIPVHFHQSQCFCIEDEDDENYGGDDEDDEEDDDDDDDDTDTVKNCDDDAGDVWINYNILATAPPSNAAFP